MTKAKKAAVKELEIFHAWVYRKGFKDTDGNAIEPGSYAFVHKIVDGMQTGDTDPLALKYAETYNTRQIKAKTK